MEEPVQALFLDEPVGGRQAEGYAGWGLNSPICLGTSTPLSVIGWVPEPPMWERL